MSRMSFKYIAKYIASVLLLCFMGLGSVLAHAEDWGYEVDPWEEVWHNQKQHYLGILSRVDLLIRSLPDILAAYRNTAADLSAQRLQRLFILSETYANNPRALEAVLRQIDTVDDVIRDALVPTIKAYDEAQSLLNQLKQLAKRNISENYPGGIADAQSKNFFKTLNTKIAQLTKEIARLDILLAPNAALLDQADKHIENLTARLPVLWKDHYLAPPISYLNEAEWQNIDKKLNETLQTIRLRVFMEIPLYKEDIIVALARFITVLIILGTMAFLGYRALLRYESGDAFKHIFYTSIPWLIVGCALVAASIVSQHGYVYQGLLNLGNIVLIIGQISLAWDLRRIDRDNAPRSSPLWPLCIPMLLGYELLHPDLPPIVLAGGWLIILCASLAWQYMRTRTIPPLAMEAAITRLDRAALWLALLLLLFGAPRYSILLYLSFVTLAVATQLALGGLHLIYTISLKNTANDIKGVLSSILLSFAAPLVLMTVVCGVTLWVVTLPGGYDLLRQYAITEVHIAGTNFNILHILLIISIFYVTRTVISLGTDFFATLEHRGIRIDNTLIPPMQTAFKYTVWGLFALFVLKSLGMELSNLAIVAGGLSVGIGFGMQAIVNNFFSGLILIFSRSLQEGDVIDVAGLLGVVRKISVRATTVETFDNAVIYVPNAEFVSSRLINWTRNNRSVRREISIGVAYGTDPERAIRLLHKAADALPHVLKYPQPLVLFTDFGDNALEFVLRFWVSEYDIATVTASELRLQIEKLFRAHGVEVAFPQLDVHIKDMPLAGKARPAPRPVKNTGDAPVLSEKLQRVQSRSRTRIRKKSTIPGNILHNEID